MHDAIVVGWPFLLGALAVSIGWWTCKLTQRPAIQVISPKNGKDMGWTVGPEPICRPLEFGPLSQPRDVIDRIRDAIVEDQLGARKESPKQRRQRMTRLAGFTDRQRVQHWLLHWREDYMADLTGRSWAAI